MKQRYGWKVWNVAEQNYLESPMRSILWDSKEMKFQCWKCPNTPRAVCTCGIWTSTSFVRSQMIYGDLFRQVILFGLTITTAIILGLVAALVNKTLLYLIVGPIDMALLGTALYRELNLTQHISGLLELSGKAFLHQEGLRGQQAKIVFLIRPFSMSRRKARTLAEHYSVPVFSWWHWKKIYRHTKLVGRRLSGDIMMSLEQARDYDAGQKPQTLLGSIN